jgi:hypothetical protein
MTVLARFSRQQSGLKVFDVSDYNSAARISLDPASRFVVQMQPFRGSAFRFEHVRGNLLPSGEEG